MVDSPASSGRSGRGARKVTTGRNILLTCNRNAITCRFVVRKCEACGVVPEDGPLPYEWEIHLVTRTRGTGVLAKQYQVHVFTCDDICRGKMGFSRRKAKPLVVSFDF